jgi:Uma2 family endonuclease
MAVEPLTLNIPLPTARPPAPPSTRALLVPPLETGDRLTREEFERRYRAMPRTKKAELIAGVVYMPSPVKNVHGVLQGDLVWWLTTYKVFTPGVLNGDNVTVRLDAENEPQPDALLRLNEALGGHSRVSHDGYLEGGPELVAEVAGSTASYDLHDKKETYRRHGVREYIVWSVYEGRIDWFRLERGEYVRVKPRAGVIRSRVFPGLRLDVKAMLAGDLRRVLAVLQEGLASKEYADFAARLSQRVEQTAKKKPKKRK